MKLTEEKLEKMVQNVLKESEYLETPKGHLEVVQDKIFYVIDDVAESMGKTIGAEDLNNMAEELTSELLERINNMVNNFSNWKRDRKDQKEAYPRKF